MLGLNQVLRQELKDKNIKVTAVLPGATLTDSWKGTDLPKERFIPAEDIAKLVYNAYTLSPQTNVEEILVRPILGDIG
jgi:NADP-dependent 3-hydroxy acid dehydrogenase YdfG